MREPTIARNYAEALFELGEQAKQTTEYAQLIDAVAGAIEMAPEVQVLLVCDEKRAMQSLLQRRLLES